MGFNMARVASMCAGIPQTSAATTVNRFCSSGSQAVMMAANQILVNGVDVAIGSGVETISMMQDGTSNSNRLFNEEARERFPGLYYPMGRTAEIVAERYDVSREDHGADWLAGIGALDHLILMESRPIQVLDLGHNCAVARRLHHGIATVDRQ